MLHKRPTICIKTIPDGKNADYIPYLANIDPETVRNQYLSDERRNHPTG